MPKWFANVENGFHQSFHRFSSFFGSKNIRYSLATALLKKKKKERWKMCHLSLLYAILNRNVFGLKAVRQKQHNPYDIVLASGKLCWEIPHNCLTFYNQQKKMSEQIKETVPSLKLFFLFLQSSVLSFTMLKDVCAGFDNYFENRARNLVPL